MSPLQPLSKALRRAWHRLRAVAEKLHVLTRRRVTLSRMRKADIVLVSPRLQRLSLTAGLYRVLLRSRYVHSILYLGNGRIIHTTARHGVVVGRIPRRIFDRSRYAIYRAPDLTEEQRNQIAARALELLDRKLDHAALVTNIPSRWLGLRHPLWRLEESRLWCSKLIADAYRQGAGIELVPRERAETVVTEDLCHSRALERI